jgi:hypothetical protein
VKVERQWKNKRLVTGTSHGFSVIRSHGGRGAGFQVRIHDCITHNLSDPITVAATMTTAKIRAITNKVVCSAFDFAHLGRRVH